MRSKLPYIILAVLFIGYILLELLGPQPTNWNPSFEKDKVTPFGSKLLFERLPDLFPQATITSVDESPTKVLKTFEKQKSNYIIIQEEFKTDQFEARALLDFVKRGNDVFIAASLFEGSLADSLDINNEDDFWSAFESLDNAPAKDDFLSFPSDIDPDQKHYPMLDNVVYSELPYAMEDAEVLSTNKRSKTMFLRLPLGEGHFYLHSVPLMFTNYFMVDPINQQYISKCLSFLPVRDVLWDEYFKPGKGKTESSMSYVLDQTSLKWAWFVTLAGVLLFVVFEGKRKQRIIPVLAPPTNTTLEFTQTVGMLYFAHGDHKDISEKKIKFLLEYIRNRWTIPTTDLGEEFQERLASKSGVALAEIMRLFALIGYIHKVETVEEDALLQLSLGIDDFYKKSK
jgi:hypothetical protein